MGRLPRRANSGIAIEALQDADDTPISLAVRSWATCLSKVMSTALDQMQRKYTEERVVCIVGKQNEQEVLKFKGADLKGCNAVRVTFGPHLTKQQRSDLALALLKEGVITREQALSIVDLGYLDEIFDAPPPLPDPSRGPVQAPVNNPAPPPVIAAPGMAPPGAIPQGILPPPRPTVPPVGGAGVRRI